MPEKKDKAKPKNIDRILYRILGTAVLGLPISLFALRAIDPYLAPILRESAQKAANPVRMVEDPNNPDSFVFQIQPNPQKLPTISDFSQRAAWEHADINSQNCGLFIKHLHPDAFTGDQLDPAYLDDTLQAPYPCYMTDEEFITAITPQNENEFDLFWPAVGAASALAAAGAGIYIMSRRLSPTPSFNSYSSPPPPNQPRQNTSSTPITPSGPPPPPRPSPIPRLAAPEKKSTPPPASNQQVQRYSPHVYRRPDGTLVFKGAQGRDELMRKGLYDEYGTITDANGNVIAVMEPTED